MEAPLYNQIGSKVGTVALSEKLFGVRWNETLVHDIVEALRSSRRAGTAHAKDRGAVRGGGKKPWRQKGTGRARHGSSRSPIWVGGGVTHGPLKDKNYEKKTNKQARRKALAVVLSRKLKDGEVIFLDTLALDKAKTAEAAQMFKKFADASGFGVARKGGRTLVMVDKPDTSIVRAIRNLPYADVIEARNANVEQALIPKYVLITKDALSKITA